MLGNVVTNTEPMQMLQFYETHVRIVKAAEAEAEENTFSM
jgi:hypothetical protein